MIVQKACCMDERNLLVNFLEREAVAAIVPDWPKGVQVAVCLTAEGGCDLAVHAEGEEAVVLNRLAELHQTPLQAFCVAPEMSGFPSHKILFSQEQDLLCLVAESDDLTAVARAYAGHPNGSTGRGDASDHPDKNTGARVSLSGGAAASFILPPGYAAPISDTQPECMFIDALLERRDNVVRLVLAPGDRTGAEQVIHIREVGSRDDFGRFVLPLSVLDGWSHGKSVVVEMPSAIFPEALLARYITSSHPCEATVTACGVFFSANALPQSAGSSVIAACNSKRRFFTSAHAAVAALVALMLVSGHFATARDKLDQSASSQGPDAGITTALELISAMATDVTPR